MSHRKVRFDPSYFWHVCVMNDWVQGSIEHISVLFSYSSTDDSIPGSEIRQPVSGEDNTEHSTMVEHPSTKVVLVPGSGLPHEIFRATEVPRNSLVNHGIANAQGQTYMEPDSKKAYESIDQTSKSPKRAQVSNDNHLDSSCQSDPGSVKADFNTDDDRTVVQESSLVLSSPKVLKKPLDSPAEPTCVREEGNESLKVPVGFPLMNVSAAISKFLVGEVVSNLDWTLINIQLNEEGKFAFEKSGLDRPEPAPDSVPSFVETSSSGSQASERVDLASEQQQARSISRSSVVLFASHSRSDSDLLNHRGISRDFGPRPRFSESHLPVHLKALTMRLGLILHETNFRMYEPLAELRYAIQGERTALALATIPRQNRKYVALPRYCFGLTREEFLGMFDTPVPS